MDDANPLLELAESSEDIDMIQELDRKVYQEKICQVGFHPKDEILPIN